MLRHLSRLVCPFVLLLLGLASAAAQSPAVPASPSVLPAPVAPPPLTGPAGDKAAEPASDPAADPVPRVVRSKSSAAGKTGKAGKSAKGGKTVVVKPVKPARPPVARPAAYELLLTFDDGPRLDTTPKVLDTLDQYGIKTVFFVNGVRFMGKGPQHEKQTALMREAIKRGHIIGNHTIHHLFLCGKRGPVVAEKEILDNAQLIRDAVGVAPPLFRTPYGSHCPTLNATLQRLGITPIGWDIDPQDWKLQNADAIFEVMKKELTNLRRARSIVLFHDVQPATIEMLPRFLRWVTEENVARKGRGEPPFKFIDYSFLLNKVGAALPPVSPSPPSNLPPPAPVPPAGAPTPAPAAAPGH